MITHVVLLKLRAGVSREHAAAQAAHQGMLGLPAQIKAIRHWQCGFNVTDDRQAWDYVLIAGFDSEADMFAYFEHPEHLKVVALWEPLAELAFGDLDAVGEHPQPL